MITRHIQISGLVQGVGFRPCIYHLAAENHLNGWVRNSTRGLEVLIQGKNSDCETFLGTLPNRVPVGAEVRDIFVKNYYHAEVDRFSIISSTNGYDVSTDIAPDLGTCDLCLDDMRNQERRYHHLFTSCIHCGPRFSIIRNIPYDRVNTTMGEFAMCPECKKEYEDIHDRRFHAQPIACLDCGPSYMLYTGNQVISDQQGIIKQISEMLEQGKIIAAKGIGGFHLLCDPFNDRAVQNIRRIKKRDNKPFALLFKNLETLRKYCFLNQTGERIISSPRRPILIAGSRKSFSFYLNHGLKSVGVMLPYMPLHYILMDEISLPALVCTSANFSGQPLLSENEKALEKFLPVCDAVLIYNRTILNKQDDSVIKLAGNHTVFIRRSRGYVPQPILLTEKVEGILAMGADMKNCFALGKGNKAILSQHIGDLENYNTYLHYKKTIKNFLALYHMQPCTVVCDMHPGYFSVMHAEKASSEFSPGKTPEIIRVQHHHAHIASVMAEHQLDEDVIGIAMDGTGYGKDEKIWGSEFMVCSLSDYKRVFHMEYLKLPGGDLAIKEPWRIALGCLFDIYGDRCLELLNPDIEMNLRLSVLKAIKSRINLAESCGMGRLFDVVSSLLNICQISGYDGEGPMRLEELITRGSTQQYNYTFVKGEYLIKKIITGILGDMLENTDRGEISSKFHNTIVAMIADGAGRIRKQTHINKVVLSGGTFQNSYLTEHLSALLEQDGFSVYLNGKVPCNDGGLALGQLAVAMKRRLVGNKI